MLRKIIPLYLLVFADLLGAGIVLTLFPGLVLISKDFLPLETSYGMRCFILGALYSSYSLAQFLFSPFFGDLADKLGRKKVLVISTLLTAVSLALSGMAVQMASLTLLLISRLLSGVFSSNRSIAQAAIADLSTVKTKGKNISRLGFFMSIGFTIGPYIGGKLSEKNILPWFNFAIPFYFATILFMVVLSIVAIFFKETFKPKKEIKIRFLQSLEHVLEVVKFPVLRFLFVTYFLFLFSFFLYVILLSTFLLKEYHFNQGQIGNWMGYYAAGIAVSTLWINPLLLKKYPPRKLIFLPMLLASIFIWGLILFKGHISLLIFLPLISITSTLPWANFLSSASNMVSKQVQGKVFGILASIWAFSYFSSTLISGSLLVHGAKVPLIAGASLLFVTSFCYQFFNRKKA